MDGMFDDQEYCKGCETETELFRNFDLCDPKCTIILRFLVYTTLTS